ncbi:hypothetical protein D3C83_301960 [compost metagenome]
MRLVVPQLGDDSASRLAESLVLRQLFAIAVEEEGRGDADKDGQQADAGTKQQIAPGGPVAQRE